MQDSISGLAGCTSSRIGRDLIWQYLKENWKKIVENFGEKSNFLIYFVEVRRTTIDSNHLMNVPSFSFFLHLVWFIGFC